MGTAVSLNRKRARFAVPTGSPGTGLKVIVGPNNSGKTTLTESLHACAS